MKIKLISIFLIIILLFSCFFVSASSHNLKNNKFVSNFSDIAELPVWSIGNFWVYDMHFDFVLSGVFGVDGIDPNDPDKGITNMRVEVVEIDEITIIDSNDNLWSDMVMGISTGFYTLEARAYSKGVIIAKESLRFVKIGGS